VQRTISITDYPTKWVEMRRTRVDR